MAKNHLLRHVTPTTSTPALTAAEATGASVGRDDASATADTVAVPVRVGRPTSAVDRVADFYGAYIDVLSDVGRGTLSGALRDHYLAPRLRQRLTRWEAVRHADGVLARRGVPSHRPRLRHPGRCVTGRTTCSPGRPVR
ncbi:hypothetical protein AB0G32_11750 [Streptomyces sp. NPDC023723]|uniref:hypothetical protein n=1 Tax=Streptomyces sp. NPDC023723 TaxID=3154323 RepID=UPI003407B385